MDEIDNLTFRLLNTSTRLYETELGKKQSELDYLKSQINPHFLYNTFESMKGCAIEEGAPKTMSMAKALGQIFRYSIKGADIVTVMEELKIIKSYVHIQQIRFGERLQVNYNFTEEVLECKMPKMILQPLVENAIFHGLEPKFGTGRLQISGKIDEQGDLFIWIGDDGMGMKAETLEDIRKQMAQASEIRGARIDEKSGIGFVNVNNRIKLIYGYEYALEINSVLNVGTEVTLKIPAGRDINVQSNHM